MPNSIARQRAGIHHLARLGTRGLPAASRTLASVAVAILMIWYRNHNVKALTGRRKTRRASLKGRAGRPCWWNIDGRQFVGRTYGRGRSMLSNRIGSVRFANSTSTHTHCALKYHNSYTAPLHKHFGRALGVSCYLKVENIKH